MAIIPNTLELTELWVSGPLVQEAQGKPFLPVHGGLQPIPFDEVGNLEQEKLFPHSVRGKRQGQALAHAG
jgi:hypothetical protein